jgi:hypothetical protein
MDVAISLQDVANIITFIVPGYFALQVYATIYTKKPREFPNLLIESVVFSVPLVAIANLIWTDVFDLATIDSPNVRYIALLIGLSIVAGLLATYLREHWPVKQIAARYGFDSPNEDFIKSQFGRLDPQSNAVTVTLKDGSVFSGTPKRMSRHSHDSRQYYYFTDIARYDKKGDIWQEQPGGVIVERDEVQYIETPKLLND